MTDNVHAFPPADSSPQTAEVIDPMETALRLQPFSDGRLWDERVVLTEIHAHAETIIHSAYEIGRRLLWAKEVLGHGQFAGWCADNLPFSERTCRDYMRVANFLVAHPALLQPLAKAGLKKTLLLTSLPPELQEEMVQDGHLAEVPVEELGDVPYVELKRQVQKLKDQVDELEDVVASRDSELERAKQAIADDTIEKSQLDDFADRCLSQSVEQVFAGLDKLHGDLAIIAMRADELPPNVMARLVGAVEAIHAHAEHVGLAFRSALGQEVYGAHLMDVMRRAADSGHPIPEAQVIPLVDGEKG